MLEENTDSRSSEEEITTATEIEKSIFLSMGQRSWSQDKIQV